MSEIESLINNIVDQDFSAAAPTFADILGSKVSDALEQEKVAMADQIFNGVEPGEEEIDDEEDITDEELDAAVQDAMEEDETEEVEEEE